MVWRIGHGIFHPVRQGPDDQILRYAYQQMDRLCEEKGAVMVVVELGRFQAPVEVPDALIDLGIPVVRTSPRLWSELPAQTPEAYKVKYGHWSDDGTIQIDGHPNPTAHRFIAECLLEDEYIRQRIERIKNEPSAPTL